MRLRRALLVTTAFSTLMFGAGAAYAQSFDWSGFYVGVGVAAGGGFDGGTLSWFDPEDEIWDDVLGDAETDDDEPFVGGGDDPLEDFPGALAGFGLTGSVGFNQQMDNFLFGIEASITSGPFKSEATYVQSGTVTYTTTTTGVTSTINETTSVFQTSTLEYTSTLLTYVTTVTNPPLTSTFTTTASTTIFQTTTTVGTTTIEGPTTSTISVTTVTETFLTTTFGDTTIYETTSATFVTDGEWTQTITGRAQIDWLATIKGRIGVTADRTLFFATGGLAIAGVTQETTAVLDVSQPDDSVLRTTWSGSNSETRFGFVVGGGIEHALDDHWIISGEAEYFNLGTAEYDVLPDQLDENYGHQTQVLDGGSVKVGVKYKF